MTSSHILIAGGVVLALIALALGLSFLWRVVVPTNMVHIVQSSRKTTSYGANSTAGNTYYRVPSFVPVFGVTRIMLPINNFAIRLDGYEAYDKDRAPFDLDLIGFFMVADTNLAAARAASFAELETQLKSIMQGAARTILARHDINDIMGDRATFGEAFTKEVDGNLKEWGVRTVKALELMDIRDAKGSRIIADIMAKKSSQISFESRQVVAENNKKAQVAEIEATQEVDVRKQEQLRVVGERTAEQEKLVGIARELSKQEVQGAAKVTKEREMEVTRVGRVREAEIARDAAVVVADQNRQSTIIDADARKQETIANAEGDKDAMMLRAAGTRAEGEAQGAAKQAVLLAPVNAQIVLAEKIASSPEYQTYLVRIREVEARENVGIENAKALAHAEVKVIATSSNAADGLSSVGDLLGAKGGVQFGAMLEGLANTDAGAAILGHFGVNKTAA